MSAAKQNKPQQRQRQLQVLTTNAMKRFGDLDKVEWPKASSKFGELSGELSRLCEYVVMTGLREFSGTLEGWRWEPYDKRFTFEACSVVRVLRSEGNGRAVRVLTRFSLNPVNLWSEAFETLVAEIEAYGADLTQVYRALAQKASK